MGNYKNSRDVSCNVPCWRRFAIGASPRQYIVVGPDYKSAPEEQDADICELGEAKSAPAEFTLSV